MSKGLSSIHLFDKYDLMINGSPIKKVMSDTLNAAVSEPEYKIDFLKHKDICGTIPFKFNKEQFEQAVNTLKLDNFINNQQQSIISKIAEEVNEYLENKVRDYCKSHEINFIQWSKYGEKKHWPNKTEYYYNEEFICGVEVIQDELIPSDFKLQKTVLLRYY